MTIITTYTLKPDTDYHEFKRWSEEEDQPVCRAKPICQRFDVYRARGADGPDGPDGPDGRVDIMEVIEATSADEWDAAMNAENHAYIFEGWKRYCELDSLRITYCEPL